MASGPTRVLIVESHELLAEALAATLQAEGIEVAIADLTDRDALVASVNRSMPSVTLIALDLGPELGDGTEMIPGLLAIGSTVIVVTGVSDRVRIAAAIEAGAAGYLSKSEPVQALVDLIQEAAAGDRVLADAERHDLLVLLDEHRKRVQHDHAPFELLTRREREVLAAIADGGSIESIATDSFVAHSTVRSQVHSILTKLGASCQIEAVAMAHKAGWLSPDPDVAEHLAQHLDGADRCRHGTQRPASCECLPDGT